MEREIRQEKQSTGNESKTSDSIWEGVERKKTYFPCINYDKQREDIRKDEMHSSYIQ